MLKISADLATAFETGTLAIWKTEIIWDLHRRHPQTCAEFTDPLLKDWVRGSMETIRRLGATTREDIAFFTLTLFGITEVDKDDDAAGDLLTILAGPGPFAARMALLRKAFPVEADKGIGAAGQSG